MNTIEDVKSAIVRNNMTAEVRRHLFGRRKIAAERGLKHGRLDTTRLHRVGIGDTQVFRRKQETPAINAAVSILLDCSGSMWTRDYMPDGTGVNRFYTAATAALCLAESLNLPGIACELIGFTESRRVLYHHPIKAYSERWNRKKAVDTIDRIAPALLHNNADGENLILAYNDIKQRKETKKVIIILSDGAPSANLAEDSSEKSMSVEEYTRMVVDMIDNDPEVGLYAVGFGSFNNDPGYKHAVMLDDVSKLGGQLFKMIEEVL